MSYAYYKTLQYDSGITHCSKAHFTSPDDVNLVVARNSLLQVYLLKDDALSLLVEYPLFGTIGALMTTRPPSNDTDIIVLTTAEAKVSILEWDVTQNNIAIRSLHYFEDSKLKNLAAFTIPTISAVDPKGTCCATLVYDRMLAVTPLDTTKAARLKSASFLIDLSTLDIRTVHDIKFLHGYHVPTMMILYSNRDTWAGSIKLLANTVNAAIFSLDTTQKTCSKIWSMDSLPHDAHHLFPVKNPGGVLVFSPNAIIYLNQSHTYCLSLNYFGDESAKRARFPNTEHSLSPFALPNPQCTFISDYSLLCVAADANFYVINLISDGTSIIKVDTQPIDQFFVPTCMTTLTPEFFFVGSKLSDSALVKLSITKVEREAESASKRRKLTEDNSMEVTQEVEPQPDNLSDIIDPKFYDEDLRSMIDQIIISKDAADSAHVRDNLDLRVVDTLFSIAPIADFTIGSSKSDVKPYSEYVCCAGAAPTGALCFYYTTMPTQSVKSFPDLKIDQCWSLQTGTGMDEVVYHNWLVLRTQRGESLLYNDKFADVTQTVDFLTNRKVVHLQAHADNNTLLIIVHTRGVMLVRDMKLLSEVRIDEFTTEEIVWGEIGGDYVATIQEGGSLYLFKIDEDKIDWFDSIDRYDIKTASAVAIFSDSSDYIGFNTLPQGMSIDGDAEDMETDQVDIEDDDEAMAEDYMLYNTRGLGRNRAKTHYPLLNLTRPTYATICLTDGSLKIVNLADGSILFQTMALATGRGILAHEEVLEIPDKEAMEGRTYAVEVFMDNRGVDQLPALVVLMNTGEMYIYQSFCYHGDHKLQLKFSKIPTLHYTRNLKTPMTNLDDDEQLREEEADDEQYKLIRNSPSNDRRRRIIRFSNSQLFVCGQIPMWLDWPRQYPRVHVMHHLGSIHAFAPFSHPDHKRAFAFYSNLGLGLLVSELKDANLESNMPAMVTYLDTPDYFTPTQVAYDPEEEIFCVIATRKYEDMLQYLKGMYDEKREREKAKNGIVDEWNVKTVNPRYPTFYNKRSHILVFDKKSARFSEPTFNEELNEFETAFGKRLEIMTSDKEGGNQVVRPYFVVTTHTNRGEDANSSGRILLYTPFRQAASSAEEHDKASLLLYAKHDNVLSGIFAMDSVDGSLIVAENSRIFLYRVRSMKLEPCGMVDSLVHTASLASIKNLFVSGDSLRGITMYKWRKYLTELKIVATSNESNETIATSFISENNTLSVVVADEFRNLQLHRVDISKETVRIIDPLGLDATAEFHVGSRVVKLCRYKLPNIQLFGFRMYPSHGNFLGTDSGCFGVLIPLEEKQFRQLSLLESKLYTTIQHEGGMNPKSYRVPVARFRAKQRDKCYVVDGELFMKFQHLDRSRQEQLASMVGTTVEDITDMLLELQLSAFV